MSNHFMKIFFFEKNFINIETVKFSRVFTIKLSKSMGWMTDNFGIEIGLEIISHSRS